MKTAGLIAEFNPFHNGHKYILEKIKEKFDAAVVMMSGSFVQRGDIAITDKHTRAATALNNGADLVLELPVIYALNTAQRFAMGAVETLDKTGVTDCLVFGSELGRGDELIRAAELLENEPPHISEKIKKFVSEGMNYPSAREKAYEGYINSDILSKPNNILAVEYIRAIKHMGSSIKPYTIERTNDFHSTDITGDVISATAVRRLIENGKEVEKYVPEIPNGGFDIYSLKPLENALLYHLRTVQPQVLAQINDVSEGLENRITAAAGKSRSFDEICEKVKSKRYTMSRIRRILLSSFLGITKELAQLPPSYIRVLGMNDTGKKLLKDMKNKAQLPVAVKTACLKNDEIFKAEIRAGEAASICRMNGILDAGREFTVSPVIRA